MVKGFKVWSNTYDSDWNPTKYPEGRELPINYDTGKKVNGKPVCRPVIIGTNPAFDPVIQDRTLSHVMGDSEIILNYSVIDKALNPYKKLRGRQLKQEGWALLLAKYPDEFDREGTDYNTDKATLKDYFVNTLSPAITNASTVQEVKNVTVNWPSI